MQQSNLLRIKQLAYNVLFILTLAFATCQKKNQLFTQQQTAANANAMQVTARTGKPNIIFILADDVGYEVPTFSGGQSYSTPNIDNLAAQGMQFSHCYSTPNCSPSRVELMSGKYSVRNYVDWGIFDLNQKTFVNYLHDYGYKTCVAGKWQFDGGDAAVHSMGFDKYLIHYPFTNSDGDDDWNRYKNPVMYQNGDYLPSSQTQGKYADDMFADYISSFIDSNKTQPFFVYFPLSLCHFPFSPTPDDPQFAAWNPANHKTDIRYFPSMVKYMDKKVGQIVAKIQASGLANDTYIFFSGDNGTPGVITSQWNGKMVVGGKETTTDYGTHVPMVVYCPAKVQGGVKQDSIIDYADIFKTTTNIAGIPNSALVAAGALDSRSFNAYLKGNQTPSSARTWTYCYWKPNTKYPLQNSHFVQNVTYKLYDSTNKNRFYNVSIDTLEQTPLLDSNLTPAEKQTKQQFKNIIKKMQPE